MIPTIDGNIVWLVCMESVVGRDGRYDNTNCREASAVC